MPTAHHSDTCLQRRCRMRHVLSRLTSMVHATLAMSSTLNGSMCRRNDKEYYSLFELPELAVLFIFIQVRTALFAFDACIPCSQSLLVLR